ncbi:hypothetical protein SCP_1600610 [Sparassis crispa]|uniref:Uncharacterized protein n=1 Tax=Sparassis crispa TaxID=139825 RepID=A0A401H4X9_9APHY|nr:hypothetical protein SCP_1600610 [Sparassis crispa]GBE89400.1 hypothetical protein SCP_1600610 [Sparassis crispa]
MTSAPTSYAVSAAPDAPDVMPRILGVDAVFASESQNDSVPDADAPSGCNSDGSESDWEDDVNPVEVGDARDDDGGFDSD